ncbi:ABC transporter substrate-binding protein [Deinococcus sp. YIM 134068]|uniref:ABC transporter substrate-binding protein n=1 Tax=Deinococcus lichenicola TaxID=3118910 RepID=UPI002F947051
MRPTKLFVLGLSVSAALSVSAQAQTRIVFWDFFGGGDGIRMKQIVDEFNASQKDIVVQRTTQTWGNPFYTKVHTAVVSGQTPDVMTYHLSALPAGLQKKDLRVISPAELTGAGLRPADFQTNLVNTMVGDARAQAGQASWYALPLDTHTVVLYVNRDLLKKAGVLGANGQITGANTIAGMTNVLRQIKAKTGVTPLGLSTNQDPANVWRLWYTLFLQQGGTLVRNGKLDLTDLDTKGKVALQVMTDWAKEGLIPKNTQYPANVALFTAGRTAIMMNGNWEVPTMVDAKAKGTLKFDYGVVSFPKLYANGKTWADSHMLAIPANAKNQISPEKLKAVLTFAAYVNKQGGVGWAGGGHIPSYVPTQNSAGYKALQPNVQYSAASARNATLEPTLPIFGVGGPIYDAVGNNFTPVLLGQLTVDQGLSKFKTALQNLNK